MIRLLTNGTSRLNREGTSRINREGKILFWLCVALLLSNNGRLHAQSASFGSSYAYGGSVTSIVGQHDFQNGSGTLSQGIIGTERSTSSSFGFLQGASWLNADDNAFIDGYATTYNTGAFIFPIGDNGKYRPAAVTAASTALPSSAAYYGVDPTTAVTSSLQGGNEAALPTGAPFAITAKATGITSVTNKEYWDIRGATAAKISLTWDATSAISTLTSAAIANLTIVGWNGTQWVNIPSTVDATSIIGGTSSLTTGSITTNAAILPNTYTVYTFGALLTCATPSVGGTAAYAGGTLCNASNIGTAMLTGQTGSIVRWETSTNNGATWSPLAFTTTSYNFANAANAQQYRAVVNNGAGCLDDNSAVATIATSAAACTSASCDNSTGNITFTTPSTPTLAGFDSKIIMTNASGVIQYASANNALTINGVAVGDYLVYRVVYDPSQLPIPVLTVGTNITAIGGACAKFTNQLAYKVCPAAAPDLTTTVGQPLTPLTAGVSSDIPVTVANIGTGSAPGTITTTITIPSGVTAPATFTSNGWTCSTTAPSVVCTNPTAIAAGANSVFNVPVTPTAASVGSPIVITATTTPVTGETVTNNNPSAPMTSPAVLGVPDLTTTVGQPLTPLTAGVSSDIPVTVANIGTGSAPGTITTTVTIPSGVTALATFTSNGWTCNTTAPSVVCTNPTAIAAGANSVFNVPVTPTAASVGSPIVITATTTPVTGETVTNNNPSAPMTSPAVLGVPDLVTTIGQPVPTLVVGQPSNLPITVANIGTGSAPGTITTTITLPTGITSSATFTNNGWTCSTTAPSVVCTNPTAIAAGANSIFNVPITPNASIVGINPIFNATTTPVVGETNTGNNTSNPTPTTTTVQPAPVGLPDLITIIGQPLPSLQAGVSSDLPITVRNIGTGSAPGVITTTITLPTGVTSPATFTSNGWTCSTSTPSVVCTNSGPIAAGRDSTFRVPVTPNASLSGTTPTFNASTAPVTGETNTNNNTATPTTVSTPVVGGSLLSIRVLLQGNYDPATGLMHDLLRQKGLIPLSDPYRTAAYNTKFTHKKNGATQTTTNAILSVTGANAIVDWVFVELHDAANPATVIATKSALLQRDGDVVSAADGSSPVYMDSITSGNYYISIRHRNHLGVMTATTRSVSATSTVVDFSLMSAAQLWNKANGDGYETTQSGIRNLLWAGDTDGNRQTVFAGPTNDVDPVFFDVMTNVGNVNFVPNYILNNQYLASDVNMDGKVIYQSADNEVDIILFMVLSHTLNTGFIPSFIIVEQLP
jgi:hypothetical protein